MTGDFLAALADFIMAIMPLVAIVAAVVGTGWIASRTLDAKVDAVDAKLSEKVESIREIIAQGTREHEEFRADIRQMNTRLDNLYQQLLQSKNDKGD